MSEWDGNLLRLLAMEGFEVACAKCTEIQKKPGCLDNKEPGWLNMC